MLTSLLCRACTHSTGKGIVLLLCVQASSRCHLGVDVDAAIWEPERKRYRRRRREGGRGRMQRSPAFPLTYWLTSTPHSVGRPLNFKHTLKNIQSTLKNVSRLFNYNPITLLKNVKAPLYGELQVCKNFTSALNFYEFVFPGKLVCVQGTVVRAGNIRPLVTRIAFQCLSCHGIQVSPLSSFPSSPPVHTYVRT